MAVALGLLIARPSLVHALPWGLLAGLLAAGLGVGLLPWGRRRV